MELRNTGKTPLSLIYRSAKPAQIHGQLTLIEKGIKLPLMIDDQVVQVPSSYMPPAAFAGRRQQ